MVSNWLPLIHPIELYGVLALTGACLLYAFLLHVKLRFVSRRSREQHEYFDARLAQVLEATERLRAASVEDAPVSVPSARQALNLNSRGQVLRMRRRGENPETIAAALRLPRNEVDLLLKVHQLARQHLETGATSAAV
ncbi:MAG TPA: hypothetical protein VFO27_19570 [Bryobacteraceae bacterium]|nr:hypothetical protein [Bryobacteraceae bacterium]